MWTLEEAIPFLRNLEKVAEQNHWHLALTGSVLYKGESKDDLDIVVYPHDVPDGKSTWFEVDPDEVVAKLGFNFNQRLNEQDTDYGDKRRVYIVEVIHNNQKKRIDLFLLE